MSKKDLLIFVLSIGIAISVVVNIFAYQEVILIARMNKEVRCINNTEYNTMSLVIIK